MTLYGRENRIANLQLKGDTTQNKYSGKNMFNIQDIATGTPVMSDYTTISVSGNTITATMTADSTTTSNYVSRYRLFSLDSYIGQTFTLSVESITASSTNKPQLVLFTCDSSGGNRSNSKTINIPGGSVSYTVQSSDTGRYFGIGIHSTFTGAAASGSYGVFSNIQLEKGSTATSYEPYVGEEASPNPLYPQTIRTVSGQQKITVSDDLSHSKEFVVNLGRNLFNIQDIASGTPFMFSGTTISVDGSTVRATLTQNASSSSNFYSHYKLFPLASHVGETYTISVGTVSASSTNAPRMILLTCDADGSNRTTLANLRQSGDNATYTVQASDSSKYFAVGFYSTSGGAASSGAYAEYTNIQLEKGSSVTPYQPYKFIELCKFGNYQDYIYSTGGNWYLHKETTKYIYSGGSQTAYFDPTYPRASFNRPDNITNTAGTSASTDFIEGDSATTNNTYNIGGSRVFFRSNEMMTSSADWESFVSKNPVTFYFSLATATNTQITDSVLVQQLNSLATAAIYSENTTIDAATPSSDGNLPAYTSFTLQFDVTKKIWKLYGSVNGVTKEITKVYGSVNGTTKRIF